MILSLDVERLHTLDQVRAFLGGNDPVSFEPRSRAEAYAFVQRMLARFGYARLGKADKGTLRRFLGKTAGLSRAQLTRLVRQYVDTGRIVDRRGDRRRGLSSAATLRPSTRKTRCTQPFVCAESPVGRTVPMPPVHAPPGLGYGRWIGLRDTHRPVLPRRGGCEARPCPRRGHQRRPNTRAKPSTSG